MSGFSGLIGGMKRLWYGADDKDSGGKPEGEDEEEEGQAEITAEIVKEDIVLPPSSRGKLAFGLHNVYSKEECEELIRLTEERGYGEALLNVGYGRQELRPDIRKSSRCIWDSTEHAADMFRRIESFIPKVFQGRKLVGLNERLRFLRYDPGDYFKPHMDGTYVAPNQDSSRITVHLYLNEGYQGGHTTFLQPLMAKDHERHPDDVAFESRPGSVLVFQHDILHEGSLLLDGRKYTVRTDVMYRR